jgi:hypothetical protein
MIRTIQFFILGLFVGGGAWAAPVENGGMWEVIKSALEDFRDGTIAFFKVLTDGIVNGFVDSVPDFGVAALDAPADYLGVANQYVPLDLLVSCILLYWGFVGVFWLFKMALKLIPTVG